MTSVGEVDDDNGVARLVDGVMASSRGCAMSSVAVAQIAAMAPRAIIPMVPRAHIPVANISRVLPPIGVIDASRCVHVVFCVMIALLYLSLLFLSYHNSFAGDNKETMQRRLYQHHLIEDKGGSLAESLSRRVVPSAKIMPALSVEAMAMMRASMVASLANDVDRNDAHIVFSTVGAHKMTIWQHLLSPFCIVCHMMKMHPMDCIEILSISQSRVQISHDQS
jgi:uncharacterized protein YggT (Ycf19 family)